MKWEKLDAFSWRVRTDTHRADIDKVSGNMGFPYMWRVYALPRPATGRWNPIAKGACRTLTEAKEQAQGHMCETSQSETP